MKNKQDALILRDICLKYYQNARIFMVFATKINKIPEFYMIIARKYFPEFWGARAPLPPSPMPMV